MKNNLFTLSRLGLLLGILAFGLFFSCTNQKHTITATIEGLGSDTVFVSYLTFSEIVAGSSDGDAKHDTLIADQDRFVYDIIENDIVSIFFTPRKLIKCKDGDYGFSGDARTMYLQVKPNEKLKITGSIERNYFMYHIAGSAFNKEFAESRLSYKQQSIKSDSINNRIEHYYSLPASEQELPKAQIDSLVKILFKERGEQTKEIRALKLDYVKKYSDHDLAAAYLMSQPLDTFCVYYEKLAATVKSGMFKDLLKERKQVYDEHLMSQKNEEQMVGGANAPDFTLKNLAGENVTLSALKGKYIVLDFWGSWCGWCVKGFPKMREYYAKYKSKVEFVGVACNDKDAAWRKAIEENQLNWTQLMNDESGDASKNVSILYGVEGYPTKMIIDANMKIVEVFIGESDEFYQALDKLLK